MDDLNADAVRANRLASSELILDEARNARALQESRVDDLRRRSASSLPVAAAAVVVAGSLSGDALTAWPTVIAAVAIAVAVGAAVKVQSSIGQYRETVNVDQLCEYQFDEADSLECVRRDLALYHYWNYLANDDGPIRSMQRWFQVQLLSIAVAAALVLVASIV